MANFSLSVVSACKSNSASGGTGNISANAGMVYGTGQIGTLDVTLPSAWTPASLFAPSEQGAWYDPSDLTTMWTDDGTTQAGVNDLVYRIDDKSGNGNHARQTTEARRPILRQDGSGNYYLDFDGTDDFLVTGSVDFSAAGTASVFFGIYTASTASGVVCELSADGAITAGGFGVVRVGVGQRMAFTLNTGAGGVDRRVPYSSSTFGAFSCVFDSSQSGTANEIVPLLNGATGPDETNGTDSGTGSLSNDILYIGRRGGTTLPFNYDLYSLIVRSTTSTSGEIDNATAYVAEKTGVTL